MVRQWVKADDVHRHRNRKLTIILVFTYMLSFSLSSMFLLRKELIQDEFPKDNTNALDFNTTRREIELQPSLRYNKSHIEFPFEDNPLPDKPITTLIIATVPYDRYHAKALWSHLECLTEKINHVLIAAPDVSWSRFNVDAIVKKFQAAALSNQNENHSIPIIPTIETDYFTNDRYDVGLWCDALKSHYRYNKNSVPKNQSIFLVNDSVFSREKYVELTDRIVNATKYEDSLLSSSNNHSMKLLSLNGGALFPNWIESIYRGFTPQGLETFLGHSCSPNGFKKCAKFKQNTNRQKQCIINYHEKALIKSYQKGEARSIYPSFYPTAVEEIKYWEKEGLNFTKQRSELEGDHWIYGRKYYLHLLSEYNFPLLKVKAIVKGTLKYEDMNLKCFDRTDDSFFDSLSYPTKDEMNTYYERLNTNKKDLNPKEKEELTQLPLDLKQLYNRWCSSCSWRDKDRVFSCEERRDYVIRTYHISLINATLSIMRQGHCTESA